MTQNLIFKDDELADLVKALYCNDSKDQIITTKKFRTLTRKCKKLEDDASIDKIIQTGIIPRFVEFLQTEENPQLQSESAKVLTEFASGSTEQTKPIIDAGAVPILIKLLSAYDDDVQEQAVWVLGNIAGNCWEYRDLLLDNRIVTPLITLLRKPIAKTAIRTICNLCRGRSPPPDYKKVSRFLRPVTILIAYKDADVLADMCWTLAYLIEGSNERIERLLKTNICKDLVQLLMHDSQRVVVATLNVLGNICGGDEDHHTQVMLDFSILPSLLHVLKDQRQSICKSACWVISNITAGTKSQIQAVVDAGIFPVIIDRLGNADAKTKKEAAWAIVNVMDVGTQQQIEYLVDNGCIPPLCDYLIVGDAQVVNGVLDGLEYILHLGELKANSRTDKNIYRSMIEDCFGLEKMKYLRQSDVEMSTCKHARDLIMRYF